MFSCFNVLMKIDMNKKTLFILIFLSLLAGIGLAGGLYLVSTPTNVSPRAASSTSFPTIIPAAINNQQLTIPPSPTPIPSTPLTRQEIIDSFGQTNARADLNADSAVNSLDLAAFDLKNQ